MTRFASGSEILVNLEDFHAVLSNSMEYQRTKSAKEARTSHGQFGSPVVKLDSLSVLEKVGSSVVAFPPSLDSQEILQFADKVKLESATSIPSSTAFFSQETHLDTVNKRKVISPIADSAVTAVTSPFTSAAMVATSPLASESDSPSFVCPKCGTRMSCPACSGSNALLAKLLEGMGRLESELSLIKSSNSRLETSNSRLETSNSELKSSWKRIESELGLVKSSNSRLETMVVDLQVLIFSYCFA